MIHQLFINYSLIFDNLINQPFRIKSDSTKIQITSDPSDVSLFDSSSVSVLLQKWVEGFAAYGDIESTD